MSAADTGTLLSVTYSSRAEDAFDERALAELLAQSRADNQSRGLTGMLLYRAGRFIQVLEGPETEVRDLVSRIGRDGRHSGMRILLEERVPVRQFPDWTMGYEPIAEPDGPPQDGFRDTFEDLEGADDRTATLRAARELSLWFRVRTAARMREAL